VEEGAGEESSGGGDSVVGVEVMGGVVEEEGSGAGLGDSVGFVVAGGGG
jgi:hypothetical protein